MEEKRPKVGLGILILKNGKFLFTKRKGSHGPGTWCPPGGHLEFNESFEGCAKREVMEEMGIEIENIRLASVTNDIHIDEDKHYITLVMLADWKSGEPKNMEPDRCTEIGWFEWENLPQPLFLPMENLVKQGYHPLKQDTSTVA